MRVDTHRHFGGCIPPEVVYSIINETKRMSIADVVASMTFLISDYGFYEFLKKFDILNEIKWDERALRSAAYAVYQRLDDVDCAFMDISFNKYECNMPIGRCVDIVTNEFNKSWQRVGLVLSVQYGNMPPNGIDIDKFVGIDLVGDEAKFDYKMYAGMYREWRDAGKMARAHVGESQSPENIRIAIDELGCTNIAHGVRIIEDAELMKYAADMGVTFDLGLTGYKFTKICDLSGTHPARIMFDNGLRITIGTDDPVQFNTDLNKEYIVARDEVGFSDHELATIKANAEAMAKEFIDSSLSCRAAAISEAQTQDTSHPSAS